MQIISNGTTRSQVTNEAVNQGQSLPAEFVQEQTAVNSDVKYTFVQVDEFQPNVDGWEQFGEVVKYTQAKDNSLILENAAGYAVQISLLSDRAIRVRFRPQQATDYSQQGGSYAVVNRNLGSSTFSIEEIDRAGRTLRVLSNELEIFIGLQPYGMSVFSRETGQLITEDTYGKNLVFSNEAVACLRKSPEFENYFGFGEKAGSLLNKKYETMTFFNYDNFTYSGSNVIPNGEEAGPLNAAEPLYNSIPFMLAIGASQDQQQQSRTYAYGLFLDNVAQSYFNMGCSDYSDMSGKYYLGALYGDLDYYILVGNGESTAAIRDVLKQYSTLTGRSAMPPKYALGYHQGCYGYYDAGRLLSVAQEFRVNRIPIDGLHIDVDFQNNYRTFTSSPNKFPEPKSMFDMLHNLGFKCSTNITGIISANPLDENGNRDTPYPTRDSFVEITPDNRIIPKDSQDQPFIYNTRAGQGEDPNLFIANESYGDNDTSIYPEGFNPYSYPTPLYPLGQEALGTYGFYCDMGRPDVAKWWGEQYQYLLEIGLDMIWQDMTCPAVVPNYDNDTPDKTLPLNLMMFDPVTGQYQPNAKIHNAFAINLIKATYEGLTKLKKSPAIAGKYNENKRNFIIARGGYAGVHRYAGIWTGDSASSWDFLNINIPEVLNIGLSGQPLSGCDIGGFANGSGSRGNGITDYELFTRWMNLGAFLPWFRNHYDGYTKQFQEPYAYGEPVPSNCRKYIELRYRLIQLYYDLMYENTQNGLPVCRALFINDAHDPKLTPYLDSQFFVGDDLLVAPVVQEGQLYRDVYLPEGCLWYVFNDNTTPLSTPTMGGTTQNWYVPLGLVPLYVREGAIIPMRELEQYIGEKEQNPITFNIYPGKDSTYTLYQDDQVSTANADGIYRVTEVTHCGIPGGQIVEFLRTVDNYTPPEKYFYIALLGTQQPSSVVIDDVAIPNRNNPEQCNNTEEDGYYFNESLRTTYIKVMDKSPKIEINVLWS